MNDKHGEAIGGIKPKEINLKAIMGIIMKRLWLVVSITIVITVLAGLYNARPEEPIYASSSRILIGANAELRGTANVLLREPIVLKGVIEELGLRQSPEGLRTQIRISNVEGSLVTLVTVIDTNPQRAADIANALIQSYRPIASQSLGISTIRTLTEAEAVPYPINSKSNTIVIVAFLAGLFISICGVFLLDSLDDSIRTEKDIEKLLGVSVLGHVPKMRRRRVPSFTKKKSVIARGETIGS